MHSKHLWRKLGLSIHQKKYILDLSKCSRHHKKDTTVPNQVVLDNQPCEDRFDIYTLMRSSLIGSFLRYLELEKYDDLKVLKQLRTPVGAQFIDYLRKHNWPADSWRAQGKVRLLDWIACLLCFQRPIKTRLSYTVGLARRRPLLPLLQHHIW